MNDQIDSIEIRFGDKDITDLGVETFWLAEVQNGGRTLLLRYRGGQGYRIPLEYLLKWFSKGPHSPPRIILPRPNELAID